MQPCCLKISSVLPAKVAGMRESEVPCPIKNFMFFTWLGAYVQAYTFSPVYNHIHQIVLIELSCCWPGIGGKTRAKFGDSTDPKEYCSELVLRSDKLVDLQTGEKTLTSSHF